jgi:threonine/homoserine efflux transporter RhtA
MPNIVVLGSLMRIAILSMALAYSLYLRILAAAGATNFLLVIFLIPISVIMVGTALIGAKMIAVDARPGKKMIAF